MLGIPKDPEGQKKFMIGAAPFVLLFVFYQFYHTKRTTEIEELTAQYDMLDAKNQTAKSQSSPAMMRAMQQKLALYDQHLHRLEDLIPSQEDVAALLFNVSRRAANTGVRLELLAPASEEPQQFYTHAIYDARVTGTFHDIGRFFAEVGSLERIVIPSDVKIAVLPSNPNVRSSGPRLQADFKLHTYVIPAPSRDSAAAAAGTVTTGGTVVH